MKKILLPVVMAFVLVGCSTYQYSARIMGVDRQNVGTKEVAAEIVADYEKVVSAQSDYQKTKNDAIQEAEHLCIINNDIDVIVDPIVKVEHDSRQIKKKYKATITGFAGNYQVAKAGVDAVTEYSKEDIEKYKLLSDPDFARYYYSRGIGDSYYINSSAASVRQKSVATSLAFAPKAKNSPVRQFDFTKSKRLRNAGIGLTVAGIVSTFVIGVPGILGAYDTEEIYYDYYGYPRYEYDTSGSDAGIAFLMIGPAAVAAGIPMWCIGSKRMKNSDRDVMISAGGSQNGLGLRFNF